MPQPPQSQWPQIRTAGFDGLLVSFADGLNEPANRAALAFRAALDQAGLAGVTETSTSLVSTYLRFDPLERPHSEMVADVERLVEERDWLNEPLPVGRRLWRIPTAFGGSAGPQLADAAMAAGMTEAEAVQSIVGARVRVQTIGFAPGMPYLGALSSDWDIPRLTNITPQVPAGGLCVAIRQLVLFPVSTPTGWRQLGRTAIRLFQPEAAAPFVLRPGDEVTFLPVSEAEVDRLAADPLGGATAEVLA